MSHRSQKNKKKGLVITVVSSSSSALHLVPWIMNTHSPDGVSSAAFSFGLWMKGWMVNQPICPLRLDNNPSQSLSFKTSIKESWDAFKLPMIHFFTSWNKNLSLISVCQSSTCRPELHVLPGNIRSLNIVSGSISDYRHTAAPPGTFRVHLAGECWCRTEMMPASISWLFMWIKHQIRKA